MILENNPLDQKSQKEIQDFYFKKSNLKNKDYADMNKKYITTQGNIKAYELAYDYAMKFNKDTTNGLYFYGDVGVGKSMLAKKIAKIVIKKCYSVYFTNVVELLGNIRQDKSEFKNSTLKKCEEIDLLIIDDLGMDVPTEREKQTMQHILDNRYRNNKPIIFTSNLSIDEIENKYDSMGRVISRLRETVQDIEIKGDDERSIVRK